MKNFPAILHLWAISSWITGRASYSTSAHKSHLAIIIQSEYSIISSKLLKASEFSIFEIIWIPFGAFISFKNSLNSKIFSLFLTKERAIKSVHFETANFISSLSESVIPGSFMIVQGKFKCLFEPIKCLFKALQVSFSLSFAMISAFKSPVSISTILQTSKSETM